MASHTGDESCQKIGSDDYREFVGEVLSMLPEVSSVEVDGKMHLCGNDSCYVGHDDCDDDVSDDDCDGVSIGPFWYVMCNTYNVCMHTRTQPRTHTHLRLINIIIADSSNDSCCYNLSIPLLLQPVSPCDYGLQHWVHYPNSLPPVLRLLL